MRAAPRRFRDADLTDDAFLGGRVKLLQPKAGYRAATDPVLLAAAVPAQPGERVLDVGSGAGAASFCLAKRVAGLTLEGIERSEAYVELSLRNGLRNGVVWMPHCGDIADAPLFLRSTAYDQVITNPPYFAAEAGPPSDNPARDAANRESLPIADWLDFCLKRLKQKGWLTLIHRAERLDAILAALSGRAARIAVTPLWPRPGRPAKRVIIRAQKDSRGPLSLLPGLTLHPSEGEGFTPEAVAILRDGAAIDE